MALNCKFQMDFTTGEAASMLRKVISYVMRVAERVQEFHQKGYLTEEIASGVREKISMVVDTMEEYNVKVPPGADSDTRSFLMAVEKLVHAGRQINAGTSSSSILFESHYASAMASLHCSKALISII